MSDIFREIDEELRRDNLQQLWKKYGNYVIVLAVLIVVATAAVVGWRAYQNKQREAQGGQYAAALDLAHQGKDADAAAAFAALAQRSDRGRAVLARLEEAASKINTGDVAGAVAIYDQMAGDGTIDQDFRDVATMLGARYTLEKGDPQTVIARLQPLTASTNAWHGLALELSAIAELKAGDTAKARAAFDALAKDPMAPQGVRERAAGMLAALAP
ncbi:MAG TPA: tetratricopeptide repeat protein [Stellaceae bacterium]